MYLGIDVSKKTIDCCLIKEDSKRQKQFKNEQGGFKQLKQWLDDNHATSELKCCCEATGTYYKQLALYLKNYYKISVENPRKIKGYAISELQRAKTDKQDAKLIAMYCQEKSHRLREWQPPEKDQQELEELTKYLDYLTRQRATEKNKLHESPEYITAHIKTTIDNLTAQIKDVKQQIKQFYKQHPEYGQNRKRLMTITGIGETAASVLLSIYKKHEFKTSKQFVAFIGLDPKPHESGTSVKGKSRISKIGKADTRKALFMPALVAYRSNAFPTLINRLKSKNKPLKVILVALMRKLAVIAFTLLKIGQDFQVERYK